MLRSRTFRFMAIAIAAVAMIGLLSLSSARAADTIFFDDFNDGYAGWSSSGNVASDNSPSIVPDSVRLKKDGMIWRTISTTGYSNISLTWNMAAQALENGEYCYAELNTGSGWTVIASLTNGDDNQVFRTGTVNLGPDADNNAAFQVRFRIVANALGDYCYVEDLTIAGTSGASPTSTPTSVPTVGPSPTPTNTPQPGSGVPGDPLTGSGNVNRTLLTYNDLMNGSTPASPVDLSAFALPAEAAQPDLVFEGHLELLNEATQGDFTKVVDTYNYDNDAERLHLPEFDFEFVQNGSHLIPVQRGLVITSHPYWNYIIGPGRVWKENGDNGYNRASFPFALVERNANCTHNGVMTFLFDGSGSASKVMYEITQETCLYFEGNFWGLLDATYHAQPVSGGQAVSDAYVQEVTDKFPTKPISDLPVDYPGTDLSVFTSGITPEHMSTWGLVVNGTNYVAGCDTRYGAYPFCGSMRLPSYSTAKTSFASLALMRLVEKYGAGVDSLLIRDYAPEYTASSGDWSSVTFDNAIDMATGNYRFATFERDEDSTRMSNFFLAQTHADKIAEAFGWPNRAAPGTTWVYHTSDIYILTWAMQNYLQSQAGSGADIYQMLVDEVFAPIGIGPGAYTTLRTSDNNWQGEPFGGYGLFFIQDDVAKIATLLDNEGGMHNGVQLLDPGLLADAMQQDPSDRGLPTANQPFMYNNGVWGHQFTTSDGYGCDFWVPFMSGYGGITVAMMPNGVTFYYFSDNNEFDWFDAVMEVNTHIASNCTP